MWHTVFRSASVNVVYLIHRGRVCPLDEGKRRRECSIFLAHVRTPKQIQVAKVMFRVVFFIVCSVAFYDVSLWPLLTGSISRDRRPELADAFLLSRSLWLKPLLSWVSVSWLPPRARESCARFLRCSLLPLLDDTWRPTGESTSAGGLSAGDFEGGKSINASSPSKKMLRLVGNRLSAVEEPANEWDLADYGSAAPGVGEEEEEASVLRRLRLASVTVYPPDADNPPAKAARETPSPKASVKALNPFFRRTDVTSISLRGTRGGSSASHSSTSPWTLSRKARTGKAAASSTKNNKNNTTTTAPTSADIEEANAFNMLASGAISPPPSPPVTGLGTNEIPRILTVPESPPLTAKTAPPTLADVDAPADKSSVTAAAVKTAKASRSVVANETTRTPRAKAVVDKAALSKTMSSPAKGSVVDIWREMQRKRRVAKASPPKETAPSSKRETEPPAKRETKAPAKREVEPPAKRETAPSALAEIISKSHKNSNSQSSKTLQVATQRQQKPSVSEVGVGSSITQAAFDAAELAMVRRRKEAAAVDSAAASAAAAASAVAAAMRLDHSALAKAGTAELHRLVLSLWTVPELLAAASDSGAGARTGVDRNVLDEVDARHECNRDKSRKQGAAGLESMKGNAEEGEIITTDAKGKTSARKRKKGYKTGIEREARGPSSTRLWLCKV